VSWLARWLPPRPRAPAHLVETLYAWKRLPSPDRRVPLASACFVVVDTETSGLDPHSARLLSIGACRVEAGALMLAPSMEVCVRQRTPSTDENILVHGIGRQRQLEGDDAADALCDLLRFAGSLLLVGYHAQFDATVLRRSLRAELGASLDDDWLDVGILLSAIVPGVAREPRELDHWLAHFGVHNFARHGALADASATGQLLLLVLARAAARGVRDVRGLYDLQRAEIRRQVMAESGTAAG